MQTVPASLNFVRHLHHQLHACACLCVKVYMKMFYIIDLRETTVYPIQGVSQRADAFLSHVLSQFFSIVWFLNYYFTRYNFFKHTLNLFIYIGTFLTTCSCQTYCKIFFSEETVKFSWFLYMELYSINSTSKFMQNQKQK